MQRPSLEHPVTGMCRPGRGHGTEFLFRGHGEQFWAMGLGGGR